ncbi:MAG: 50S ribosomal protein L10 [Candidatus Spechtbacterales bacterium]
MAISREKKEEVVKELKDLFEKEKVVVFTDFKGMNVNSMSQLKNKIREGGGVFKIAKKTLIEKALEDNKPQGLEPLNMEGQIAVAFGFEDPVSTAKIIYQEQKETEKPVIIAGLMGKEFLDAEGVKKLALLPTREELLAKVVGSINAPLSGFVNVLHGNLKGLVYALNAIKEQKS